VAWLRSTHDYFLAQLPKSRQPGSPSAASGSAGRETASGTTRANRPEDSGRVPLTVLPPSNVSRATVPPSNVTEEAADLLDRRSIVGHLAGAVCPHCQGPGRCFMCDFEAGVCTHCRGTGVDIGPTVPEGEESDAE